MSGPMSPAPKRIELCGIADVESGGTLKVEAAGLVLAVFNVDGEFFVTDDACTHGPGALSEGCLENDIIECNFHGGQFNVRTGEVVGPPCMTPVKTYTVIIEQGKVFISAPE